MIIPQVKNTEQNARAIFQRIVRSNTTPVIDLDEVLFCAKHRQTLYSKDDVWRGKCGPDQVGQLDLDKYRSKTTRDLVMRDKNLPLLGLVTLLNDAGIDYHVATARVGCTHTLELLKSRGVRPRVLICREGEHDSRKDNVLKADGIRKHFPPCLRSRMILIDDNLSNCNTLRDLGMQVLQITASDQLDIRDLI